MNLFTKPLRFRVLFDGKVKDSIKSGIVLCWLSRDIRAQDNWSLLHAQTVAKEYNAALAVAICIPKPYISYTTRHYEFYLDGLKQVYRDLKKLEIDTHISVGQAGTEVPKIIEQHSDSIIQVVCDFCPLREHQTWVDEVLKVCKSHDLPFHQVDAHNVVPVWTASDKQEYAARTIRKKINSKLDTFLEDFPTLEKTNSSKVSISNVPGDKSKEKSFWEDITEEVLADVTKVPSVSWCKPGPDGAKKALEEFCTKERLGRYAADRNDPNTPEAQSDLSPYFHFGHLSPQRAVLEVQNVASTSKIKREAIESFMEEAIVRRELSDNFCFYNENYDSLKAAHGWAAETLKAHADDEREHVYSKEELESGKTHDDLWNASQMQLVHEGKLHGFLRMYWAKKILEWTSSPEEALKLSLLFNDKYSLDGNDPNGMVGCGWSIYGLHDQGWRERPIFGKVRYMNYAGCKRKFDIPQFVKKYAKYIPKGFAGASDGGSMDKYVKSSGKRKSNTQHSKKNSKKKSN